MRPKVYRTQPAAFKAGAKLRSDPADRMVRKCEVCPTSTPTSLAAEVWASIAARLAVRFDLDVLAVRRELDEAREGRTT